MDADTRTPQEVMDDFHRTYGPQAGEKGPELFVENVLGVKPDENGIGGVDEWQRLILRDLGRYERRISIRSCHGPGKTAVLAWCVLYMLVFRFPQKTVATAPTRGQLFDALFAEVMIWFGKMPLAVQDLYNTKSDSIDLISSPSESFFSARTARPENPEAMQGVHAPNVLLIADEASGVPEPIFEAAVGSMSGENATTILASNPVRTSGFFFDTHHKLKSMWKTYHISAEDSPRVTDDFCRDVAARYGEDSGAYRVRVLGEFPKSDEDTVIPYEVVHSAVERDLVVPRNPAYVWGLDVARFGDDKSVLLQRSAFSVDWAREYKSLDLMQLVGRVKHEYDILLPTDQPREILVDSIGLGAGVVDRLRELGLPARGINVGESAAMKDAYLNLRAELWFEAKEWLEQRSCKIQAGLDELCRELVMPKYTFTSSGRVQVESKADMKKRGHKSPNYADAFVLSFAGNAATTRAGKKARLSWNKPLIRGLKGIV